MKSFDRFIFFVVSLLAILPLRTVAQITVLKADFQKNFNRDQSLILRKDTDTLVNVGMTGGPNQYDFSSLTLSESLSVTLFQTSEIPFLATRFDTSSYVWGVSPQNVQDNPIVYFGANDFETLGSATIFDSMQTIRYDLPHEMSIQFPATYSLSWSTSGAGMGVETTYVNGSRINTSNGWNSAGDYVIDGFGTLTVAGKTHQCLRIKYVEVSTFGAKTFSYLTKDGILFLVESYKNQNDTGFVQVKDITMFSGPTVTAVGTQDGPPEQFRLAQNYPNPFNPSTLISFQLPVSSDVKLEVFDLLGRSVALLVNEKREAGSYSVSWDASRMPSGIYFARMQAGEALLSRKMVLIK